MKMTVQIRCQMCDGDLFVADTTEAGPIYSHGADTGCDDPVPVTDHANTQGNCDRCGELLLRFRGQGDITCHNCGANYNCSGQRLRDDLRTRVNESEYDDDIGDLEGDELSYLRQEAYDGDEFRDRQEEAYNRYLMEGGDQ